MSHTDHDTHEHHHIELPAIIEPAWAKIFAPLCALAILGFLYCNYQHLV